jgi:hypothetical protein
MSLATDSSLMALSRLLIAFSTTSLSSFF